MTEYSITEAAMDLRAVLDKAPAGAVSGEWFATTEQAGVASQSGGYMYANGGHVIDADNAFTVIRKVIGKLEASRSEPFNKVIVRWTRSKIPLMRSRVTVETFFDESIIPRGPNSAVYEAAAVARRAFWQMHGNVSDEFIGEQGQANAHNQTIWFGPHRRVLSVENSSLLMLATDGLSTPWAGIAEPENGVQCELFMEFDASAITSEQINDWAHLLISLGDLVADGFQVASDVDRHGAILFYSLTDDFSPMTRIILSRDNRSIEEMPFGSVPLIRVTPITEAEIDSQDQSDEWASHAARHALSARKIEV